MSACAPTLESQWRRSLWLMVALRAAMSLSFSISSPFLPLFLIELGVRPLGVVEMWSGAINSINFLVSAIVAPFWGSLSDRVGRKAMVLRSCAAACLFTGMMGLCQNAWELFAVVAFSGIFGGFSAASAALVGTQVPEEQLGFSLGWLATGQLVGGLIGPLFGGLLADRMHNYRAVFFLTSLAALGVTVACAMLVREDFRRDRRRPRTGGTFWGELHALLRHPALVPLLIVVLLAQVTAYAATPIVPLFVRDLVGDSSWLATFAGASVAVMGVADLLASPWLGKRSDRIGYRRVLVISLVGAAAFTLPQAFAQNIWAFLALRFGVGIFLGGILPAATALIGRLFPREIRGQVYGITASATFFGMFCGPLAGGFIAAHFGFAAVFLVIGVLTLANLACVLGMREAAA